MTRSYALEEIETVVKEILPLLKSKVICFKGEMGAGKTTLIQSLCAALAVVDVVSSPTFSLINEYQNKAGKSIYHFDCYRIESEEEALDFGAEEYLYSGNFCLIEWAENIASLLPEDHQTIELDKTNTFTRTLTLK
ncbi:tRNA (adenosine(37)-N6)-threonylcarbamoyltransferase complex ATPase subunit type 1 TsaE [Flavobacteriaceae bacterium]|nr:tRNA (adenosine(37)-N6)-threonylcarbamoyltransferase complex ATPase subunit type 1 TsaE [Flavobacteriaceae bacterium]